MCRGKWSMRRHQPASAGGRDFANIRGRPRFRCPGPGHRDVMRRMFLEEEFRRPNHWLGMKTSPHGAVMQRIAYCHDGHTLMVCHESTNDPDGLAYWHSSWSVIERFVETVTPLPAAFRQPLEVLGCFLWLDHGRQSGRVRRHDRVCFKSPLITKARNTKIRILICIFEVTGVIRGLRNTPRDP